MLGGSVCRSTNHNTLAAFLDPLHAEEINIKDMASRTPDELTAAWKKSDAYQRLVKDIAEYDEDTQHGSKS
ncbi:abc drug exporter [Penicillium bovifimosum]|uniref:Abc drug exporter n=1 Tax=Penicillium bovifimosum TaxID=126998 RepID=A0A9W9GIK5_9EURO|nr:abc drug exporter [Penicillium bovifimosum]KAJ5121113.1 abc drug exporter [Penicillium bovifimosum]